MTGSLLAASAINDSFLILLFSRFFSGHLQSDQRFPKGLLRRSEIFILEMYFAQAPLGLLSCDAGSIDIDLDPEFSRRCQDSHHIVQDLSISAADGEKSSCGSLFIAHLTRF